MSDRAASSNSGDDKPLLYVVDDERPLLDLTSTLLEAEGFRVICFASAESAFDAFASASRRPDVLITDYAMGLMNGMQLIEACRCIAPEQKTLLVSGTVEPDVFIESEIKPDDFLRKPFGALEFIERVRRLLDLPAD